MHITFSCLNKHLERAISMTTYIMKTLSLIILILISLNAFSQDIEYNHIMYVISEDGLNIRKTPDFNAEKILTLRKGSEVQIQEIPNLAKITLPNGYYGNWLKINYGRIQGFVFDAYLSKLKPIDFLVIDEKGCWQNDILRDWASNIGKIDSIEYESYGEGEGTYRMNYLNLKNGHKYIEHYHWEHFENEIQLQGLRPEEMDQFVRSILGFCNNKNEHFNKIKLTTQKNIDISISNECCMHWFRIKVIDGKLIIKTQIDPGS